MLQVRQTSLRLAIIDGLQRPPLSFLSTIKVNNGVVKLFECWPVSNGEHGDASLHAGFIQLDFSVCTHLQFA